MKMHRLTYFFILMAVLAGSGGKAQVFSNEMSALDKINVYKIVTFDEFINRFNNDAKSNIRMAYRYYHVDFKIKRPALVRSLFDYETKVWDTAAISGFVADVLDARGRGLLSTGANLFAEAMCRFWYRSAQVELPLVLRYMSDPEKGSKWVIAAVGNHRLDFKNLELPRIQQAAAPLRFINPVNNEINFTELLKVFEDKENLHEYFEKNFFQKRRSAGFYNAITAGDLKFLYVKEIRYHALQYDNWIFTVKEFRRSTLNSGWLINKLVNIKTPQEKDNYLKTLMGD